MNDAFRLLADLTRLGIEVVAHEDRLRYRPRSALTPNLAERLRTHKAELMAILRPPMAPGDLAACNTGATGSQADAAAEPIWRHGDIEPPEPCPDCGGLLCWWNAWGDRRCMVCNPPTAAIRLLARVQQIRRRHGIPSPPGAAEMLADLKRSTTTCQGAKDIIESRSMKKRRLKFSDQLRQAIEQSDKTRYRISQETGVSEAVMSRFMNRKVGLSIKTVDLICNSLGLRLVDESEIKPKQRTKKGR